MARNAFACNRDLRRARLQLLAGSLRVSRPRRRKAAARVSLTRFVPAGGSLVGGAPNRGLVATGPEVPKKACGVNRLRP